MKRKYILILGGFFLFLYLGTYLVEYVIREAKPKFQDAIIENFKNNNELIKKVGSYQNHEFSYPQSELSLDSLHFELIIFGSKKCIIYSGCAVKEEKNNWKVKRIESKTE
jgi:hypothetical protein